MGCALRSCGSQLLSRFCLDLRAPVDPFEIEVYDGTANQPGMPGPPK